MSLELTELFGAKAGDHFFFGVIKRWKDTKENPVVFSRISIPLNDWFVSQANDQRHLSNMLNEICHMVVYNNIHADAGKVIDLQYPNHFTIPYSKEFNQFFLNQMKEFELLKRTYPVSEYDRICEGYLYILDNTTAEQRKDLKINARELQREIKKGEKYIYQVAKENGVFKTMSLCFSNYEIIRKKLYKLDDE